jgi:1-deoxy-D-xylulose-5-phosphate synthase
MAPKNRYELSKMMDFALEFDGPVAIKYPRGSACYGMKEFQEPMELGKSEVMKEGNQVAILGVGSMMEAAYETFLILEEEGYTPTLVNARFIKPLDEAMLAELAKNHELIVTIEENIASGSYGQAVAAWAGAQRNHGVEVLPITLPDLYLTHGNVAKLKERYGLTAEQMAEQIKHRLQETTRERNEE